MYEEVVAAVRIFSAPLEPSLAAIKYCRQFANLTNLAVIRGPQTAVLSLCPLAGDLSSVASPLHNWPG